MINKLSITLSIAAVSAAVSLAQPAMADPNPTGARFDYAPNVWKEDVAPKHKQYTMTNNPLAGRATPNMLFGNNPTIFQKPAPPPAPKPVLAPILTSNPFVHAQMQQSFGKPITPQGVKAPPAVAWKPEFGTPNEVKPPVVAMQAKPQTVPPLHEPVKSNAARPSEGRHSSLSGKMFKPAVLTGNHAAAASLPPQIASYGQGVGYQPGALVPRISSGSASSSTTAVSGRVMSPIRHH